MIRLLAEALGAAALAVIVAGAIAIAAAAIETALAGLLAIVT
jgi:hypothetical protein